MLQVFCLPGEHGRPAVVVVEGGVVGLPVRGVRRRRRIRKWASADPEVSNFLSESDLGWVFGLSPALLHYRLVALFFTVSLHFMTPF